MIEIVQDHEGRMLIRKKTIFGPLFLRSNYKTGRRKFWPGIGDRFHTIAQAKEAWRRYNLQISYTVLEELK